jgi:hypothetical protein
MKIYTNWIAKSNSQHRQTMHACKAEEIVRPYGKCRGIEVFKYLCCPTGDILYNLIDSYLYCRLFCFFTRRRSQSHLPTAGRKDIYSI